MTTQDAAHLWYSPEQLTALQARLLETWRALAQVNQRVAHSLGELGATAAREGLRTSTELQTAAFDAMRSLQGRPASPTGEGAPDAHRCRDAGVVDPLDASQQTVRLAEASAQAMIAGTERLLASTERAGRGIQEAVGAYMGQMDELYRRA